MFLRVLVIPADDHHLERRAVGIGIDRIGIELPPDGPGLLDDAAHPISAADDEDRRDRLDQAELRPQIGFALLPAAITFVIVAVIAAPSKRLGQPSLALSSLSIGIGILLAPLGRPESLPDRQSVLDDLLRPQLAIKRGLVQNVGGDVALIDAEAR